VTGRGYPRRVARAGDDLRADAASPPPATTAAELIYATYFVLQAVVGVALWLAYAASPAVRTWVGLVPTRPAVTAAFVYPDLGVIVLGSLLSAWTIRRRAPSAVPWSAFTAGGVLYPTLYLLGWVSATNRTGEHVLAIMIPPALLSSWIAYQVWRTRR